MMVLHGCGDKNTSSKSLELPQSNDSQRVAPGPAASAPFGNANSRGLVPDLLNQKLWGQGFKSVFTSLPGDSDGLLQFGNLWARP